MLRAHGAAGTGVEPGRVVSYVQRAEGWTQQEGFSFLHAPLRSVVSGPSRPDTHPQAPKRRAWEAFLRSGHTFICRKTVKRTPTGPVETHRGRRRHSPSDSTKHTDEHKGRFLASFLWRTYVCSEAPHSWDRDRVRSRQFRIKSPEDINSSRGLLTTSQVKAIHKQQTTIRQPIECDLT